MTIGEGRQLLLWQILTGSEKEEQTYQDIFLDLKEEILKIDLRILRPTVVETEEKITNIYIPKEVKENKVVRFGETFIVDKKKKLGSQYIKEIKQENKETDYYLTYEHLFSENIANLSDSIILVGAYGSGKTFKLRYVWYKYVNKYRHCDKRGCSNKKRVRILFDVQNQNFKNAEELYRFLYKKIFAILERELGKTFQDKYKEFSINLIERFSKGEDISFVPTLIFFGLSLTKEINYKDYIEKVSDTNELEQLLIFAFAFCGWLERKYCPDENTCVFFVFDNIDEAQQEIQEAIISILEKREINLPILCACRPETLRNWKKDAIPLLYIPHIGPSSYEVVMSRLSRYLEKFNGDDCQERIDDLRNKLKNIFDPKIFIDNLRFIYKKLESDHFEKFFKHLFGWQIREALRFAQGIIDAAASQSNEVLQEAVGRKSPYALKRIIYRPWGIKSPKLRIVNIYQQGGDKKYRFAGLRTIILLNKYERFTLTVKDINDYLYMFGFRKQDTINILQSMIQSRLIITATKEYLKLDIYKKCKDEYVKLTEIGHGFWHHSYESGYIETVMYYCICNDSEYRDITDKHGLIDTFKILRIFLKESAQIEFRELDMILKRSSKKKYFDIYGENTIVLEILTNIIRTIYKIYQSEKRKLSYIPKRKGSDNLLEMALDFLSDYNYLSKLIEERYRFTPTIKDDMKGATEYFEKEMNDKKG